MNIQIAALIVTVISTILLPIIFKMWPERKQAKRKEQVFTEDLEFAELFCEIAQEESSLLLKDRATQKLIHRKDISFGEAKFFYNFRNMESLLLDYIAHRAYLDLKFEEGELTAVNKVKNPHFEYWGEITLYVLYLTMAMSPLLFWDFYQYCLTSLKKGNNLLIILEVYIAPYLLAITAMIRLFRAEKLNDANKFYEKLKKYV